MLTIEGGDVELDREMIEMIRDPLVHIIRNAIDHGIEAPAERARRGQARGRAADGRGAPVGQHRSSSRSSDDGAGIDTGRLVAKHARVAAAAIAAEIARADATSARLELIFEPGLSSRDDGDRDFRARRRHGRRARQHRADRRADRTGQPAGQGLAITIHVPLTLSILPTIVLGAGAQRFALARQSVVEIVAAKAGGVRIDALGGGAYRDRARRAAGGRRPAGAAGLAETAPDERPLLAIVAVPGGSYALAVDSVLDSEELVVKPASPSVMGWGLFAGQTLPDTGVPMLVLDAAGIASQRGIVFARDQHPVAEPRRRRRRGCECLLFIDGRRGAARLPVAAVDRLEDVQRSAIGFSGGRLRLTDLSDGGGRIVPVFARAALPETGRVTVIRLRDGRGRTGLCRRRRRSRSRHSAAIGPKRLQARVCSGSRCTKAHRSRSSMRRALFGDAAGVRAGATGLRAGGRGAAMDGGVPRPGAGTRGLPGGDDAARGRSGDDGAGDGG